MERRRGRRDNGLQASDYAAVGDLDPRVGEHLLEVLGAQGIAAYLQPSVDVNPVTRDTLVPSRPVDRLYADRAHLGTARDYLRRLAAEEEPAAHGGAPGVGQPEEGVDDRPAAPPGRSHPDRAAASYVDATFEGIVAGFHRPVAPGAASWPAAEEVTDDAVPAADPDPAPPAAPSSRPADARRFTEPSLLDALDTFGADLPDDPAEQEERFVPPPPPPLPRLSRQAVLGTLAILVGLVLLLTPGGGPFGRSEATLLGFAALLGGSVALILRLRPGTDPDDQHPDDGAQV